MHTIHREACRKKAYEIAFALFRAGKQAPYEFRRHLEDRGLALVGSAVSGKPEEIKQELVGIEYLLKLGIEGGYLSRSHEQIIYAEVAGLFSFVLKSEKESGGFKEEEDLSPIFKPMEVAELRNSAKEESPLPEFFKKEIVPVKKEHKSPSSDIRQSTILERIRQFGNCRLKDLQDVLPDVSERTLRYDLQELVNKGEIRRIGSGGPGTFYESADGAKDAPEDFPIGDIVEA